MSVPQVKIAQLDEERLAKLRDLENDLGIYLVALQLEQPLTNLSDDQVRRLHVLEEELHVTLVAHQHNADVVAP